MTTLVNSIMPSFIDDSITILLKIFNNNMIILLLVAVIFLAAIDQFMYRYRKGSIAGPSYVYPFIGKLWASLVPKYEGYLQQWNYGDISCSSVLHKFIVFASGNKLARKVFNTPEEFTPAGVVSMRKIMLPDNWIFLSGKKHIDYRKKLAPLFTRTALASYLPLLQHCYREHIAKWIEESNNGNTPIPMQFRIRNMNMKAALGSFCGDRYMYPGVEIEMSQYFNTITFSMQLVNIPLAIPGTALYDAIQCRDKVLSILGSWVEKARFRMNIPGELPESLLDRWVFALNKEQEEWNKEGEPPHFFTTNELAMTLFTFIFASQDASTSSLTWAIQILADHPEVLKKIKEEQSILWPNKEFLDLETLNKMNYLEQVVKELLRYRPPVLMMPYVAQKDTTLDGHPISKNTFIVVGLYPSLHDPDVYSEPEKFNPDRFSKEMQEDKRISQNYMVWGHGPHMCIGRDYAIMHLMAFISYFTASCNWEHIRTEKSDNIVIMATTFPEDGCNIKLSKRS